MNIPNDFFSCSLLRSQLRSIGVNPANMGVATWDHIVAEINAIFNPSAADDAALAVPARVDIRTVQHNIQTKTSFGMKVENSTSISRTNVRLMAMYRF